ncbi:MAG TPA: NUDIX hydrolase [Streptomyces sp.]|nr:NUDIX hydrolase [Streptomyces sp.]
MTTPHPTAPAVPATGPGVQVAAALLRRGDHIVLVREQRDGEEIWSIPGGGVERGELFQEAVIREVAEETGLRLAAVGPLACLVNTTSDSYPSTVVCTFECTDWDGDITVHDPDGKVTGAVLLPVEEAKKLLASSNASRPEIEPLLAYLEGAPAGRVWAYRDTEPIS